MRESYKNLVLIAMFLASLMISSCSRKMLKVAADKKIVSTKTGNTKTRSDKSSKNKPMPDLILEASNNASGAGKNILEMGHKMVFDDKTIVKGGCWNYINEVYKRAGYATDNKVIYKSKKEGPYCDVSKIEPGDWLYYVNYSYNGVEHSGIFVYWKDLKNKIGVTLSYGGEKRNEPGRYLEYDLKSVYYIVRPGAK